MPENILLFQFSKSRQFGGDARYDDKSVLTLMFISFTLLSVGIFWYCQTNHLFEIFDGGIEQAKEFWMTDSSLGTGRRKKTTVEKPARGESARRLRQATKSSIPKKMIQKNAPGRKLTQLAYERLLRAIVQGRLDLGEPLSENDLAQAMNLSKAPIRESLGELRLRGLVEVIPRSGSYVFSPTAEQIAELCDYRILLEINALRISINRDAKALVTELRRILAAMEAAQRNGDPLTINELDKKFHMAIIRHGKNRYLTESYEHIGLTVEALRYRVMSTSQYRNRVHEEHVRFVDLLAKGQIAMATRVLEKHIQRVKRVQSTAEWGPGRLRRKDYRFRDYSEILL